MTTELDIVHTGQIVPAPAPRLGTADAALEMLLAHDRVMGVAHKLAKAMVNTALVPVAYRGKPDDAAAAILFGAELGLSPIQSLQNVINIHGKPSLEARTMVALLQNRGYRFRTLESTDESVTVECTTPDGRTESATWTIERATKAGYVSTWDDKKGDWVRNDRGKIVGNTKYHTDSRAMLWAKGASELARHLAPDVLLGIAYTREDLESEPEPEPVRATARRLDTGEIFATGGEQGGTVTSGLIRAWPTAQPADDEDQGAGEAASNQGAKPDNAQADDGSTPVVSDDAAQNPESDSGEAPAKSTRTQQQHISKQLEKLGATEKGQKLAYLATFFKREFTTVAGLSRDEADEVIDELDRQVAALEARDGGSELDSVAEATDTEGTEQAAGEPEAAGR